MLTSMLIKLVESEQTLRNNAILESKSQNHPLIRARNQKNMIKSLIDDGASTWLNTQISLIVVNLVNWERFDNAFRNMELK